jgi:hypothetical protein
MRGMTTPTAVRAKDRGVGKRTNAAGHTLSGGTFAEQTHDDDIVTLTAAAEQPEPGVFDREYESRDEQAKAYMAELDEHIDALTTDEGWQDYLDQMSGFRRYSLSNQMLLSLQLAARRHRAQEAGENVEEQPMRVAPFSYWEALARKQNPDIAPGEFLQVVKKGESALTVLGPKVFRETIVDGAGNPVLDDNGKPKKREVFLGFAGRPVFDISQVTNVTLPDDRQTLSEEPPAGFMEDLEEAVAGAGYTLEEEDIAGSALGYTTTDGSKRIVVKKGLNAGSRARVLAHELGHVYAGHTDRDDYHVGDGGHRGDMEVEADSISYLMLRANGLSPNVGRANAAYNFGWAKHADHSPKAVRKTGDTIAKAFEQLTTDHNWRNMVEPTGDAKKAEAADVAAIQASIKAEKDAKRAERKPAARKKRGAPARKRTAAKKAPVAA